MWRHSTVGRERLCGSKFGSCWAGFDSEQIWEELEVGSEMLSSSAAS